MLGIILGCCTAWLGIEPSLNQPRPHAAQAIITFVVPAAYWDEDDSTFIPPAPLPEFFIEEGPQIRFEFSQIESCSDSDDHPPAPPAELDCVIRRGLDFDFMVLDTQACDGDEDADACGGAYSEECGSVCCRATGDGPTTVQQLHQLHKAIDHLNGAGMPEMTNLLREQYRDSVSALRKNIQQELESKEAELNRLQEEIQLLKSDLIGDAELEIKLEHWVLDLQQLREAIVETRGPVQQAAKYVLEEVETRSAAWEQVDYDRFLKALGLLGNQGRPIAKITTRPTIRTQNGHEATVFQGVAATASAEGNSNEQPMMSFTVKPEIQIDGQIRADISYEHRESGEFGRGSRVSSSLNLTPGKTVWVGGSKTHHDETDAEGNVVATEVQSLMLVTPRIIRRDDCQEQSSASCLCPTIVGLQLPHGPIETTEVPEPAAKESPIHAINPAFYVGDVPQSIQEKWNRAVEGRVADRITSTESPKWVERLDAPSEGAFRILRFVPDESFPKLLIEPPAHLDDSGILLQAPVLELADPSTVVPRMRLQIIPSSPLKRVQKADPAAKSEALPAAPAPTENRSTKDDPET